MNIAVIKASNKGKLIFASYKNIDLEVGNYIVFEMDKTLNIGKIIQLDKNSKRNVDAEIIRCCERNGLLRSSKLHLVFIKPYAVLPSPAMTASVLAR